MAVLVINDQGKKRFHDGLHVHGVAEGHLLLAAGTPGAGLDAEVKMRLPLDTVRYVETVTRDDGKDDGELGAATPVIGN